MLGARCSAPSAALLHAIATVTFGVDHIVSGVAINIIAPGRRRGSSPSCIFANLEGGGANQSPASTSRRRSPSRRRPTRPARWLESKDWFLVSDVASLVAALTTDVSCSRSSSSLLVAVTCWVLWRTAFGLRLRSCGENPQAAESLGVNVLPPQVHRRDDLRRASPASAAPTSRWWPRSGYRERPDRRPRLHRPGGDDLRQLAPRRAAPGRCCSATPTRSGCAPAASGPRPAAAGRRSACWRSRPGGLPARRRLGRGVSPWSAPPSCAWFLADRRGAARVHRR